LNIHVESVHKAISCSFFDFSCSRRDKRSLTNHISTVHEGKRPFRFACLALLRKKVNELLRNILVNWLPKTTKNQVTKMG
jgi:hypothetical protein